jgi:hypothetical protein
MAPSLSPRNHTPQDIPLQDTQDTQDTVYPRNLIEKWFVEVNRPDGSSIDDDDFRRAHRSFEELLENEGIVPDPANTSQNAGQTTKCDPVTGTIMLIRENCRIKRSKLDSDLRAECLRKRCEASADHVTNSIDRALRLFLTINSRTDDSHVDAPNTPWPRNSKEPLCDFVRRLFLKSTFAASNGAAALTDHADATSAQQRLTHRLTAANFKKFTNIEIAWTDYLLDHLAFDSEYKLLTIFRHRGWLEDISQLAKSSAQHTADTARHREAEQPTVSQAQGDRNSTGDGNTAAGGESSPGVPDNRCEHNRTQETGAPLGSNFLIPVNIIDEAIATLDYLFPQDKATMAFLQEEEKRHKIAINVLSLDPPTHRTTIRLKDFNYYHDRMLDVAYEYTNPPTSWRLVWKDRRNPVQFWTFWLGLGIFGFTILFGILASAYAGLQYKVAVQSLHADAVKSAGSKA